MQKQQPDLFGAKAHPTTHIKYRPEQVFIHYVESNSLKLCASSYVEEYLKMQNYSRGMTESERVRYSLLLSINCNTQYNN